ncbi:MAG: hypothetical protein AAGK37_09815 [Pseudomonadota bacterium]
MSIGLILLATLEATGLGGPEMHCSFPPHRPGDKAIEIVMQGRPSLKDLPGLYRVEMKINGNGLQASAQPILGTEDRDVLVRAATGDTTFYAVGFDDKGAAALNVVWAKTGENPETQMTRTGHCRNFERYIHTWSTS